MRRGSHLGNEVCDGLPREEGEGALPDLPVRSEQTVHHARGEQLEEEIKLLHSIPYSIQA